MSRHVPHVLVEGPWSGASLPLDAVTQRHLRRVLRLGDGTGITYTNGGGLVGSGILTAAEVRRGEEQAVDRPVPRVVVAVAPLRKADRSRFLVEKLAELGVDELVWIRTAHGSHQPPRHDKAQAWARAGLEQSRGAWKMHIRTGLADVGELSGALVIADPAGKIPEVPRDTTTLLVGPEGGFAVDELPPMSSVRLSHRVLRSETAAIVGAAALLMLRGDKPPSVR